MSKPEEFPKGNDNTKEGKEARLAKLKANQREKQLSEVFEKIFYGLYSDRNYISFYAYQEWMNFCKKFDEVIKTLFSLDVFDNNPELKTECEEVLVLLKDKDKSGCERYSVLIERLVDFLEKQGIQSPINLPK